MKTLVSVGFLVSVLVFAFLATSVPAAVIGHWMLDETVNPSGGTTAVDSSVNGLNGTYQPLGGPGPVVGIPGATPTTGTAADFNGGADEIFLASPAALKMANDFTITAWVNPDVVSGVQRVFSQYPAGGIGYGFGLSGDDLRFTTYGIQDYNTGTINMPTDHWSHIALTFDSNNDATFFVNGQPRQTITGGAGANIGNNNFFIGSFGTGERFNGQIDDVQVHTGVLSQPQIQQIAGPVRIGHWKLDETASPSGNTPAADSSGNNLNGTYQPLAGPGPVVGIPGATPTTGTAADFNGGADEIFLGSPADLKMGNNFTIAAWINPDAIGGVQRVFSQYPAGGIGYGFGLTGDDLRLTTYGVQDYNTNTINVPTDHWTHVAVAFDENNDATFFVNGQPRQTITGANPANIGNNNFFIGATGAAERFNGQIDDVQVYTGTLSQPEIQQLAGPVLIGHWALDERGNPSGNTPAADSSGNNLNGTYQPLAGPGPVLGVSGATQNTGTAADFNGGADEIFLGSPGDLKMGNNFTIAAWINPDEIGGVQRVFSQYPAGGIGYGFGLVGDDLRFTIYGRLDYNTSSVDIPTDEWTHVAVIFDENNDASFFVGGEWVETIAGSLPANIGNNNFFIGSFGTGERFNGQLDDVRVYTGALSEEQLRELAFQPVPEPSTVVLLALGILALLPLRRRRQAA
ncbi:MAG: LamG domain-containing protein [Planctomycetes bacterium]|nr:LamG domain-containing protein [Planctomycetota bacterium]